MSLLFASGRRRSALVAWLVTVLGMPIGTAAPALAQHVHLSHTLFGMHDGSFTPTEPSYATLHEGSVRLWDVGVSWPEVEVAPGVYHWGLLDHRVADAQAAHASVTMVVAMTPSFYGPSPTRPPRNLQRYRSFVAALMRRYRHFHGSRGIDAYEVWNEANISTFWTGSPLQMAQLSRAMYDVRNRVDPHAKVIAPPMVARLGYQLAWLRHFYGLRLHGTPVWRYYDALAFSLYPLPRYGRRAGGPEDVVTLLREVRARLHGAGVPRRKPIWNTEVNYGLQSGALGGHRAVRISDAKQASYVVRTYLLNAANGVKRVFWYRYDMGLLQGGGTLSNTLLSTPGVPTHVTPAGHAYRLVQHWMTGTLVGPGGHRPCQRDSRGTYTCVVSYAGGTRRIYWNPYHQARVTLARSARARQGVFGATSSIRGGSRLTVDYRPVMVDSPRR